MFLQGVYVFAVSAQQICLSKVCQILVYAFAFIGNNINTVVLINMIHVNIPYY